MQTDSCSVLNSLFPRPGYSARFPGIEREDLLSPKRDANPNAPSRWGFPDFVNVSQPSRKIGINGTNLPKPFDPEKKCDILLSKTLSAKHCSDALFHRDF